MHVIIAQEELKTEKNGDWGPPSKMCSYSSVAVVPSTSAIIPKANINIVIVIPNINILGGDEVKPGLLQV
jgi:hypothetical protein